ncbi:polysaccharide pyruvyl transferase family protein [Paratractidigestivibacter sp.]|uniref:polysaccharide pyruvyl transferase family protein n=1 Tax=Paratractidigestivibacter sp. TaxID=2847316 RepID=UPI002ABE0CAE|nr:polysaccharide pyruvyl transferase family protein [Paratractidigestivibacter sp.]
MKIAIATIQSINYGNRLQNYALQQALKPYGKVVSLRREKVPAIKLALRGVRKYVKHDSFSNFREFDARYVDHSREVLSLDCEAPNLANAYDKFVIGSDQVWNPNFPFNSSQDYLPMVPPEKKLAYAVSFGVSDLGDKADEIAGYLQGVPHISMREDAGAELVRQLTGRDVPVVLDPTMLLSPEDWTRVARRPKGMPKDRFIFKYVLGNDVNNERIQSIADGLGATVVDVTDGSMLIGPSEFVWLVANCEAVCTDSFHASVFALLHHKPLGIFERVDAEKDMSSRFDTLCRLFTAEKCRARNDGFDMNCMDWSAFETRLAELRMDSHDWLNSAINVGVTRG